MNGCSYLAAHRCYKRDTRDVYSTKLIVHKDINKCIVWNLLEIEDETITPQPIVEAE